MFVSALENFHFCFHYLDHSIKIDEFKVKIAKYVARISHSVYCIKKLQSDISSQISFDEFLEFGEIQSIISKYKNRQTIAINPSNIAPEFLAVLQLFDDNQSKKNILHEIYNALEVYFTHFNLTDYKLLSLKSHRTSTLSTPYL